jgi:hypothetical protein
VTVIPVGIAVGIGINTAIGIAAQIRSPAASRP